MIIIVFAFNKLYMPGSYVAFNLLPSDPFDLLASCIVSLTQRINKYVCMYVSLNINNKGKSSGSQWVVLGLCHSPEVKSHVALSCEGYLNQSTLQKEREHKAQLN